MAGASVCNTHGAPTNKPTVIAVQMAVDIASASLTTVPAACGCPRAMCSDTRLVTAIGMKVNP